MSMMFSWVCKQFYKPKGMFSCDEAHQWDPSGYTRLKTTLNRHLCDVMASLRHGYDVGPAKCVQNQILNDWQELPRATIIDLWLSRRICNGKHYINSGQESPPSPDMLIWELIYYIKGAQWLRGRVLDSRPRDRRLEPHRRHCVVALSKTHLSLPSNGSTQEDPSRHNWKIVDWDVKIKLNKQFIPVNISAVNFDGSTVSITLCMEKFTTVQPSVKQNGCSSNHLIVELPC